jgi:sugar (pentulose or hexulose) kinase
VAIGIDVGTSGVRAALVDAGGTALAWGAAPLAADLRRSPEAWWLAVEQALDRLRAGADVSRVRAIAVDGTSGTVLPVDSRGTPVAPASLYNDPADPALVGRVAAVAPRASAAHGATSPLAKLLSMQAALGVARVLHQADWIAGRLGGRFGVSDENNALKAGYDPILRRWPAWFSDLGVRPAVLPEIVEPGTPIALVSHAIMTRFGFPPDTAVVAGTTDGCAAFLATGASAAGEGVTSLGSTLTIKLLSDSPVFAPEFGIYSHRLGGRWLPGGASNSGGAALARHFDGATLARLSALIDPSRDSGLDYYPLPAPGERFPVADPALAPRESPRPDDDAAFLHGLLEGIARIEALAYARLAELGAPKLCRVRSVGGGAGNAAWSGLRARILGVELAPARSEEAAVGVALLALRAASG